MGQKAFVLCLYFFAYIFPPPVFATISLTISNFETHPDYYSVDALVDGIATSSACYVQAAFTATSSARYFGQTWSSNDNWFQYQSSPSTDFVVANFPRLNNGQTVKILIKPDLSDRDYQGPDTYILKLKRYTGQSSSAAGESNVLTVNLTDIPPLSQTPSPTTDITPSATPILTSTPPSTIYPTSTPSPNPSLSKTPTPTPTKVAIVTQISAPTPSHISSISSQLDVLSSSTDSSDIPAIPTPETQDTLNPIDKPGRTSPKSVITIGIALLGVGLAFLGLRLKYLVSKR